jgi:hypothetical protein
MTKRKAFKQLLADVRELLNAPFDEIRIVSEANRIVNRAMQRLPKARKSQAPDPNEKESGALALSSISASMVGPAGLEPATYRL